VALRIAVGELGVVDHLDAVEIVVDEEQRGQALAAVDHVGHHDVDRCDVAGGHEPLLAVDAKAAVGRRRGRLDARGIRSRVALGDRVRVLELTSEGGA
jgi:hypothetical protein